MRYLYRQFRTLTPLILLAYTPTLAALVGIAAFAFATGRHVWFFTIDPFVLGHLPFYAGILSNVGILLWCATTGICFFSAAAFKEADQARDWRLFLFMSGSSPRYSCVTISFRCTGFFIISSFIFLPFLSMVRMVFLPFGTSFILGNKSWRQNFCSLYLVWFSLSWL